MTAIHDAIRLLKDAAQELIEGISIKGVPDFAGEPDTAKAYDETMDVVRRLEHIAACAPNGIGRDDTVHGVTYYTAAQIEQAAAKQAEAIAVLIAHAEGRIAHNYNDDHCPGGLSSADSRAPDCPVCKALMACTALASPGAVAAEPTGWQPIETAPKDGEIILLASITDAYVMVREGRWDAKTGRWSWPWISDISPTLWMPIPLVPKE